MYSVFYLDLSSFLIIHPCFHNTRTAKFHKLFRTQLAIFLYEEVWYDDKIIVKNLIHAYSNHHGI